MLTLSIGSVIFVWGLFHKKYPSHQSLKLAWKCLPKISFKFPRGQQVKKLITLQSCQTTACIFLGMYLFPWSDINLPYSSTNCWTRIWRTASLQGHVSWIDKWKAGHPHDLHQPSSPAMTTAGTRSKSAKLGEMLRQASQSPTALKGSQYSFTNISWYTEDCFTHVLTLSPAF